VVACLHRGTQGPLNIELEMRSAWTVSDWGRFARRRYGQYATVLARLRPEPDPAMPTETEELEEFFEEKTGVLECVAGLPRPEAGGMSREPPSSGRLVSLDDWTPLRGPSRGHRPSMGSVRLSSSMSVWFWMCGTVYERVSRLVRRLRSENVTGRTLSLSFWTRPCNAAT
jgi:hypothetical protein